MELIKRGSLAVVDDTHFYNCHCRWEHGPLRSLADLAAAAEAAHLTHVWIVPGTSISEECAGWDVSGRLDFGYLSVQRPGALHETHIEIGWTERSRWPWKATGSDSAGLLRTLIYLESSMGFPAAWTPAWCSLEVLRRENSARWSWLEPVTVNLEEKGFSYKNHVAKELHWPVKGQEKIIPPGATHLVRLDGNGAYASGMTGLRVGQGNPLWSTSGGEYDGKKPGIWRVECFSELSDWNGHLLPSFELRTWLTTDLIEQLRRAQYNVVIEAGWYWPRYHQTLRSTAETLWKQRVYWRALEARGPEFINVHESYRQILKALHGKLVRADNAPHFQRPDIWAMVVSRSVALTIYRAEKIRRELGLIPVGVKADELEYAVEDPHIFDQLVNPDKLGGLKISSIEAIGRATAV